MICPECQSEFVEILERREQSPDEQGSSSSNPSLQYRTVELRDLFPLQDASLYEEPSQQSSPNSNGTQGNGNGNRQTVLLPYFLQGQNMRHIPFMLQVRMDNPQNFTNVLNQLLGQLAGRLTNFGDYVPDNALQAILDQLYLQYRPPTQPRTSDKVIASLPVTRLTAENMKDHPEECPVCKCNFEIGEESKELPCTHRYHVACIDRWLMSSNLCPLCRYELEKEESDGQAGGSDANQDGSSGETREPEQLPDTGTAEGVIHISDDESSTNERADEDNSNRGPRVGGGSASPADPTSEEPSTDLDLD
ncbi:uncharacterized protein LOC126322550 isoform X2 [Schistocerca gregaria]|nr:uncharacterized protein LOC126322550 isoform X2 [Schistocerca gregaria]